MVLARFAAIISILIHAQLSAARPKGIVTVEIGNTKAVSYSQIGQDVQIAQHFAGQTFGYFVEVGAYNGVEFSNSYMLEKYFNWSGVLVEPLPTAFNTLRHARKASTHAFNVAADAETGRQLSFVTSDMFSGDAARLSHPRAMEHPTSRRITVHTRTLTSMLDEAGAPSFIEFLSVDTEGAELDILHGIDWERYSFGYMCIETNSREPSRTRIREYLESKGYAFHRENVYDDDYIPAPK